MWRHYPNLMRAAFGQVPIFTPLNTGECSLFNNSSGPHLLRVWGIGDKGANQLTLSFLKGRLTTQNAGNIVPAVTDEAPPPGVLDKQDVITVPLSNFALGSPTQPVGTMAAFFPIAVLRPGWSLVASTFAPASAIGVCFWWDYVFPIELLKPDIGDPEIDG